MTLPAWTRHAWLPLTILVLYIAAIAFRPLIPVDETRYLTVAWEMYLRQDWLEPLTLNFQPYHHKPPLLFWLINAAWGVFGVSRWAATVPVVLSSLATAYLTGTLARLLFPESLKDTSRTVMVMVASVPFLAYGTVVLFDLTLTVFVLLSLIGLVLHARARRVRSILLIGMALGFGVLAKGPVALLYVIFPALLAPIWAEDFGPPGRWYAGLLAALVLAVIIVLGWLVPVLTQADGNFAYWLLWEQTAGRVTGNLDAHVEPFYFYLPLLPLMAAPWILLPTFWRGMVSLRRRMWDREGTRFLVLWIAPTFLCFCLISGKQPHYLVPLLPGVVMMAALCLRDMQTGRLARTVALMVALIVAGQAIASVTILKRFDLAAVAAFVSAHRDRDWAFVNNYHGELGFLARLEKPVADLPAGRLAEWFALHPQGFAVVTFKDPRAVATYHPVMDMRYRGGRLGIFSAPDHAVLP